MNYEKNRMGGERGYGMIRVSSKKNEVFYVEFMGKGDPRIRGYRHNIDQVFKGEFLETFYYPMTQQAVLFVGCGNWDEIGKIEVKEIFAKTASMMKGYGIKSGSMDVTEFITRFGRNSIYDMGLGLWLGTYEYSLKGKGHEEEAGYDFQLNGIMDKTGADSILEECRELAESMFFARDMVNTPGNQLRPMDFARSITDFLASSDIEIETIVYGQLKAMGFQALAGIGGSSEYPPCMMVLRYKGDPKSKEVIGLIGKGVTCDTGGYCLKGAKSMYGIKGDMAGAAAVAGAVRALAARKVKANVTACLPLCENRISQSALLPGDVITGYSGKTIEILNTDAEGRLILSDAVSYGIINEKMTKVLDIATLTGAVCTTLGFSVAGAMSDNDDFYGEFEAALKLSGERYLRFPFGREHEKMIDSSIADVKNIGGDSCGTITAGLFIRRFAQEKPWIHLDIAGTACVDTPNYAFESKGATGAGITSMYFLVKEGADRA